MSNNSIFFIGIDLGDKQSVVITLDQDGEMIEESRISTTQNAFTRKFKSISSMPYCHGGRNSLSLGKQDLEGPWP